MKSEIYTYALIRCLYNKNEDYIDTFWPFIVNVLPKDKTGLTHEEIQSDILKKYRISIPLHSLGIISTRASSKNVITKNHKKCFITDKGLEYISKLESERDESRRINELIVDAKQYLHMEHAIDISHEEIENVIEKTIKENLEIFEQFLGDDVLQKPISNRFNKYDSALIDYLFYVEKSKPNLFKTLQDIVFGSIISTIVNQTDFEEFDSKISKTTVICDANYLFSLLGLHYPEHCKPAKELYELMKKQPNIDLKVFEFTVEEMSRVLSGFFRERNYYPSGLKIDSIYSHMQTKGYKPADVRELIARLETRLWDLGISIIPSSVDLNHFTIESLDRRSELGKYKENQGLRGQNHDLAAIEGVKSLRRSRKKNIVDCEAMFLTSDLRLGKFNYNVDGHKLNSTIAEVIPDKILTNILWLKNPKQSNNLHLSSWISLHSKNIFIDRSVWKIFYDNLKILRDSNKINEWDFTVLIYDKQMQEILRETDPTDVSCLEGEKLLEQICEVKQRIDKEQSDELAKVRLSSESQIHEIKRESENLTQSIVEKHTRELLQVEAQKSELVEKINDLELENILKEQNKIEYLSNWKKEQEVKTEKLVKYIMRIISLLYVGMAFFVLYFISEIIVKHWTMLEPYNFIVTLFFTSLLWYFGITKDTFSFRSKLKEKLYNTILLIYYKKSEDIENILSL